MSAEAQETWIPPSGPRMAWDDAKADEPSELAAMEFCRKLEIRLNVQREALEAADECLALIEDVGHGAMSDNVTVARGIVLAALSQNVQVSGQTGAMDSAG